MGKLHSGATEGEIHQIHDGEYNTYALMAAASYSSSDIGKVYRATNDGGLDEYYLLKDTTPTFYKQGSEEVSQVTTSNDTETNIYSLTTATDYIYHVHTTVIATVDGGGNAATYERIAGFKNDSGTLSIIGSTTTDHTAEDDANWDCQIEASGTSIQVNVTGVAATTINWESYTKIYAKPN